MEWSPGIILFVEKSCRGIFTLDLIVCLEEQPWCGGQGFFGLLRKAVVKWSQEIDLFVKKSSREMVTQYSFAFVSLYLHLEKQSCYSFPEFRTRSIDNCFTLICMQKRESSCFFYYQFTPKNIQVLETFQVLFQYFCAFLWAYLSTLNSCLRKILHF